MSFLYPWNIIGHKTVIQELENDISEENLHHAYLFAGPEQIGKFTLAKGFAKILQCELLSPKAVLRRCEHGFDPYVCPNTLRSKPCSRLAIQPLGRAAEKKSCGICPTCIQIEKGYHLDTIELADDKESLKIEQIRAVLNQLYLFPQSFHKILLVQNIERMTDEAANALLKTLEDPPSQVKFLLTTSNLSEVLSTVLSRVRMYKLQSFSQIELQKYLQQKASHLTKDELETISVLATGKLGKALDLLQDTEMLTRFKEVYYQLGDFLKERDRVKQFQYIAAIANDSEKIKDFLEIFLAVLRYDIFKSISESHPVPQIRKKIGIIQKIFSLQEMLKRNVNARLVLENLMLAL